MLRRRLAFVAITLVTAVSLASLAVAQPRKPAAKPPAKRPPSAALASGAAKDDGDASAPLAGKEGAEPSAPREPVPASGRDAGGRSAGGGVLEQKTLDGGSHVFRFGEVEVEGRLKSPQIVYFLRRVRAEFAAGDLGHRSFMSELRETKNDPSF